MKLREILIKEDGEAAAPAASNVATTSADIATVSYPLLVKGKNKKEKRKNARAAVGQKPDHAPSYIGTGVFESDADVAEAHALDNNSVIYRFDMDSPMDNTEVLMLGGSGRYTLKGLRNKARKEAAALTQDLQAEHGGSFRDAAINVKQLTNTLDTIVAAYNELNRIRRKGGRGSRGITDEGSNFIRECISILENYTLLVSEAAVIAETMKTELAEAKMNPDHASVIKGMFHLNTDPGYGFYRYAIHVAGNHGGDKTVLGPNGGPFAYAYTPEEEKMIHAAVKAITGKNATELTGGKSREPDFVNKNSTVPSIDWKKIK